MGPDGATTVAVGAGEAVLRAAGGAVTVPAGQTADAEPGRAPGPARPQPPPAQWLRLTLEGGATPLVCDAASRCVGLLPVTGVTLTLPVNHLAGAYYSGPAAAPQLLALPDPLEAYTVVLAARSDGGPYHLEVAGVAGEQVQTVQTVAGVIGPGQRLQTGFVVETKPEGGPSVGPLAAPEGAGAAPGPRVVTRRQLEPVPPGAPGATAVALLGQRAGRAYATSVALGGTPTPPVARILMPNLGPPQRLSVADSQQTPRPAPPPTPALPTPLPEVAAALRRADSGAWAASGAAAGPAASRLRSTAAALLQGAAAAGAAAAPPTTPAQASPPAPPVPGTPAGSAPAAPPEPPAGTAGVPAAPGAAPTAAPATAAPTGAGAGSRRPRPRLRPQPRRLRRLRRLRPRHPTRPPTGLRRPRLRRRRLKQAWAETPPAAHPAAPSPCTDRGSASAAPAPCTDRRPTCPATRRAGTRRSDRGGLTAAGPTATSTPRPESTTVPESTTAPESTPEPATPAPATPAPQSTPGAAPARAPGTGTPAARAAHSGARQPTTPAAC